MKQLDYALVCLIAALIIVGGAYEIGEFVNATHAQMCVEPSALPWLWCSR